MKFIDKYFKPNKNDRDVKELKVKKGVFKTLYKGIKIPWLSLSLGAFFAVFNSLVILSQYDNYMAIFTGKMTNLTPLWLYLLASFVQYLIIFAGVLADLGFVTINTNVRKKMWKKMMHLPLKDFDVEPPNGMLSRITSDAEYASKPFYAIIAILQIVTYVLSISKAAPKDLPQALIILVITLALATFQVIISVKICSKATTLLQNSISLQTSNYAEQLANIKFIKASNAEEKAIKKSDELIDNRYRAAIYNAFATAMQTLANNFTSIIIYSCAFLGGIFAILNKSITSMDPINAVYVFGMAVELTLEAIMTMPTYFASTFGGSKKIVQVFGLNEENVNIGQELANKEADIKMENVSFGYDQRNVIKEASLVIPKGEVTAIIGENGSGKSTIIKLIDRLYEADSGDLYLGCDKASDISLKDWRSEFGIVSQNARLFSGSIKDNILYGVNREVGDDELKSVIIASSLEDVIASHEEGLSYDIGIHGSKLSGGEAQRLSIARALIKNPEYLVLDEATANLDKKTEAQVNKALKELMKDRTTIVIAHHYSAIKDADNIILLDHGEVIKEGKREDMLRYSSFFHQMAEDN